jgi:hypothetical protein
MSDPSGPASQLPMRPFPSSPTVRVIRRARESILPDHFAVVDGALFANSALSFASAGLKGRPIFLEAGDADAVASGPFLIPLDTDEQVRKLVEVIGDGRAPVIWSWQYGEQALYRHLRTLNAVSIPVEQGIDDDEAHEAEWTGAETPAVATVLVRHWDPDVLVAMQQVWRPGHVARVLGPSGVVAYLPERSDVTVLQLAEGAYAAEPGLLTFTRAQMDHNKTHRSRPNSPGESSSGLRRTFRGLWRKRSDHRYRAWPAITFE